MIFPTLVGQTGGYINLDTAGSDWLKQNAERFHSAGHHPLLDPRICATMVDEVHNSLGLHYSYGGWLEDRSRIWDGSYLSQRWTFIHLGIDVNAPSGTPIASDLDAEVVRVDDDFSQDGGWGPHVILRDRKTEMYLIYAHLDEKIQIQVGDKVCAGQRFAAVGHSPENGNWYPHVHVQAIQPMVFKRIMRDGFETFDGYGSNVRKSILAAQFPDPLRYIKVF